MKITDYGLWYNNIATGAWGKNPVWDNYLEDLDIYLSGSYVGRASGYHDGFSVLISKLDKVGFKINPKSPGERSFYGYHWCFPRGYIPTESDFEEMP